MKIIRGTKIVKLIKFAGVWDKLEAKKLFPRTMVHRVFETNSSFHVKGRTTGKV